MRGLIAFAVTALCLTCVTAPADAAVTISFKPPQNMNCSAGVCAPTAKDAVLNVGDLQTMLASGNVSVTTTAPGVQAKDIRVVAAFSWNSGSTLALDAHQSLTIDQPVTVMGLAGLTLTTNDGGKNGLLSFGKHGNVTFANLSSSLTIDGIAYTLENSIASLANAIAGNASGAYGLANSYDASPDGTYTSAPIGTVFNGTFEGLGNTISNLTIDDPLDTYLGFFGILGDGRVGDFTLENASVTLQHATVHREGASVGVLAGNSDATIAGVHATGSVAVQKNMAAGGLVGGNDGSMTRSDARVAVTVGAANFVGGGGLVGGNSGTIMECYAAGSVNGKRNGATGLAGALAGDNFGAIVNSYATGKAHGDGVSAGLVGLNGGTIGESYSTGNVQAPNYAGGLVGYDQSQAGIRNAYWDTDTSGITNLSHGAGNVPNDPGITGLTTQQLQSGLPDGFDPAVWAENPNINGGLPYLIANPPPE